MQPESVSRYSTYFYGLDDNARQRYMAKLELIRCSEDPYVTYDRGILSAEWHNWPQVEYADIYTYLIQTPSVYTGESLKAYKSLEAYNMFINGWVENIACYMTSSGSDTSVVIGHSQRLSANHCKPWIAAKKEGTIFCGHCTCMAGLGEACSHIGALLFTLEKNTQYQNTTACTSLPCSWLPSTFQKVPYAELSNICFAMPQRKRCRSEQEYGEVIPKAQKKSTCTAQKPSIEELNILYSKLSKAGKPVVHSLLPGYSEPYIPLCSHSSLKC